MNKEQQQIIDEAYEDYESRQINMFIPIWSQEEFINKCKMDNEFSEKWGLKIEERELSLEERIILAGYDYENRGGIGWNILKESVDLDNSIPRKVTTITYKEQTIESYE